MVLLFSGPGATQHTMPCILFGICLLSTITISEALPTLSPSNVLLLFLSIVTVVSLAAERLSTISSSIDEVRSGKCGSRHEEYGSAMSAADAEINEDSKEVTDCCSSSCAAPHAPQHAPQPLRAPQNPEDPEKMDIISRRRDASPIFTLKQVNKKTADESGPKIPIRSDESEMLQNGFYWENIDENTKKRCVKINRIPLHTTADVKVVNVYSPSLIFVRINNSIRDQLVLREPSLEIAPLDAHELTEFYYVLCPVEERAFGRARILKIKPDPADIHRKLVQLILIDEGTIVWANSSSLISMDPARSPAAKDFAYHPWQVQAISLAGIHPRTTPLCRDRVWKLKVRTQLKEIIEGFDEFKVKAVLLSVTNNDYGVATAASLYGLNVQKNIVENADKKKREKRTVLAEEVDIGSMLAGALPYDVETSKLHDGKKQERFEIKLTPREEREERMRDEFVVEWRRRCIPEWKGILVVQEEKAEVWAKELDEIVIEDMTVKWLTDNKYKYGDDKVVVCLEGLHTQSPWEFYGRPIRMYGEKEEGDTQLPTENINPEEQKQLEEISKEEGNEGEGKERLLGETDAMKRGNTILLNHAKALDLFYAKDINRKGVTKNEIERMLRDGKRPFMISQAGATRGEFTGKWQRVEVLETKEVAAVIRFLDSGGVDLVQYGSLFHIHPQHTVWPGLCVQLCVHGWELEGSERGETWIGGGRSDSKLKSIESFQIEMREDLPIYMDAIDDSLIPRGDFNHRTNLEECQRPLIPYVRGGVLFVRNLKVLGRDSDIMAGMKNEGTAKPNPNAPFPLKV